MAKLIKKAICLMALMLASVVASAQYTVTFTDGRVVTVDGNTHPSGIIYDDGGLFGVYSNNFAGMVIIAADLGDTIEIQGWVRTEGRSDQLFVYNGNGRADSLVGAYYGDTVFSLSTTTGYLSLWFSTDISNLNAGSSYSYDGFELSYIVKPNSCSCNILGFEAQNVTPNSIHLSWNSSDTLGPFLLHSNMNDTLLYQTYCNLSGLLPNSHYDFSLVSLADTSNSSCPRHLSVTTPCYVANLEGVRPIVGDSDTVILTAALADSYLWSTGAISRSIMVTHPGNYYVVAYTEGGCSDTAFAYVAKVYLSIDIDMDTCLCPGDSVDVRVGFSYDANFRIDTASATLSETRKVFLPDGTNCDPYGCSYRSEQTFSGFPANARIESVNDIRYIKLNLEHSWLGDLYVSIHCPDSHSADILRYSNVGTSACRNVITAEHRGWASGNNASLGSWLGDCNIRTDSSHPCDSTAPNNIAGTGWNYCWSDATDQNYQYSIGDGRIYRAWNVVRNTVDSSNVAMGRQFYHPDDSFSNLIGCPMNGTWYIEVVDGWSDDNGYIFGWELALNPNRLMSIQYRPTVDSCTLSGAYISRLTDTSFRIKAPEGLTHDTVVQYVLHIIDSNGYVFDTTFNLRFSVPVMTEVFDSVTEDELPRVHNHVLFWSDTANVEFRWTQESGCGCDSIEVYNLFVKRPSRVDTTIEACGNAFPLTWNNHTFSEAGVYYDTLQNQWGLDSLVVIHVRPLPYYDDTLAATICYGTTYSYDERLSFSAAGLYMLYDTVTAAGCDSIRHLDLAVRDYYIADTTLSACDRVEFRSHGIDTAYTSDISFVIPEYGVDGYGCTFPGRVNIRVRHSSDTSLSHTGCDSYEWNSSEYTAPLDTALVYRMGNANSEGCDSVVTLSLVLHRSDTLVSFDTICEDDWLAGYEFEDSLYVGDTVSVGDMVLDHWGFTPDSCPRLTRMLLHIDTNKFITVWDTIVENEADTFHYRGVQLSRDTNIVFRMASISGCDTTIYYHLHVWWNVSDTIYDTLCNAEADAYDTNGSGLHLRTLDTIALTDVQPRCDTLQATFFTVHGADSVVTAIITIYPDYHYDLFDTVCLGSVYHFDSVSYQAPGSHLVPYQTLHRCDSVVALSLSVVPTYDTALYLTIALGDTALFADTSYTLPGIYSHHDTTARWGCDSVATLYLAVVRNIYDTIFDSICEGGEYLFWGQTLRNTGEYNVMLPQRHTFSDSVRYTKVLPGDTLHTLYLTVLPHPTIDIDTQFLCLQESPSYLLSAHAGVPYYQWMSDPADPLLQGHENDSVVSVSPQENASYYLIADYTATPFCPSTDTLQLDPLPWVNAKIGYAPEELTFDIRDLQAVSLDNKDVQNYLWNIWYDGNLPFQETTREIYLQVPDKVGIVHLQLVVSNAFCADTDTVSVRVKESDIFFPNVFTPRLQSNQRFRAYGVGITEFEIWIYDRRGVIVYHSTDMEEGWDGTSQGEPCRQETYAYQCRYKTVETPGGWQKTVGTATLLR